MTLSITDDNAAGSRFPWLATGGALCAEAGALTAGLGHVVLAGALILATSAGVDLVSHQVFRAFNSTDRSKASGFNPHRNSGHRFSAGSSGVSRIWYFRASIPSAIQSGYCSCAKACEHQNLGTRVSMDCCSRIQIAIKNADRYPQSVSLELVLIDTTAPSKPYLSLERAAVNSTRPWTLYGNRLTTSETLNFGIPPHSAMHRFDEVMIIFRLNAERADAEAKIGIDQFMFVPRRL